VQSESGQPQDVQVETLTPVIVVQSRVPMQVPLAEVTVQPLCLTQAGSLEKLEHGRAVPAHPGVQWTSSQHWPPALHWPLQQTPSLQAVMSGLLDQLLVDSVGMHA